jgi:hypothetical protein
VIASLRRAIPATAQETDARLGKAWIDIEDIELELRLALRLALYAVIAAATSSAALESSSREFTKSWTSIGKVWAVIPARKPIRKNANNISPIRNEAYDGRFCARVALFVSLAN